MNDSNNFKNLYWIEASGAIAHWESKYGAVKIPFVYVQQILGDIGLTPVEGDSYKYLRNIKGVENLVEKIMFGCDSQETLDKMFDEESYIEYEDYLDKIYDGDIKPGLYESNLFSNQQYLKVVRAMRFIEDRYYEQYQFYNIMPHTKETMRKILLDAQNILKNEKEHLTKEQYESLKSLYQNCLEIYRNANVMIPKRYF